MPDFDTLRRLAVAEPERLDELLRQQIEGLIDRVSPEQQQRLRGLQFRIDCQRKLAKNNMDSCIRIAAMMHDSFYSMRSSMPISMPNRRPSIGKIMWFLSLIITTRRNNALH